VIRLNQDAIRWRDDVDDAVGLLLFPLEAYADETVGELLAGLISAVSEAAYCATWHTGVEVLAFDGADPFDQDMTPALVLAHARLAGGWVAWDDDLGEVVLLDAVEWAAERARGPRL